MDRFLVTGAAGFIGSHVAQALVEQGASVRAADDLSTGNLRNLEEVAGRMEMLVGDLAEPGFALAACEKIDVVLHHAAIPSVAMSVAEPQRVHRANTDATLALLLAACRQGVRRLVYVSSCAVYGDSPELPKRETMLPEPLSPYAVSKLAGEQYGISFWRVYGLEVVALRYFNIFGPRQDASSPYSGVVAAFVSRALSGEPLVIYGDGEQSRDFCYVENVVTANLLAAAAPSERVAGKVFNIGTGKAHNLKEVARLIRAQAGREASLRHEPARPGDIRHSVADITRARRDLGYEPGVDLQEGLRATVAWYRRQPATTVVTGP
jgi:nucleoside-diphosphate-sugar epimerase